MEEVFGFEAEEEKEFNEFLSAHPDVVENKDAEGIAPLDGEAYSEGMQFWRWVKPLNAKGVAAVNELCGSEEANDEDIGQWLCLNRDNDTYVCSRYKDCIAYITDLLTRFGLKVSIK